MRLSEILKEAEQDAQQDAESVKRVKWWTSLSTGDPKRLIAATTGNSRTVDRLFRTNGEISGFVKEYYTTLLVKLDDEMSKGADLKTAVEAIHLQEYKDDTSLKETLKSFPTYLKPMSQIMGDISQLLSPLEHVAFEEAPAFHLTSEQYANVLWVDINKGHLNLPKWKRLDGIGKEVGIGIIGKEDPVVFSVGWYDNPHINTQQVIIFRVEHVDRTIGKKASDELIRVFENLNIPEGGEDVGL